MRSAAPRRQHERDDRADDGDDDADDRPHQRGDARTARRGFPPQPPAPHRNPPHPWVRARARPAPRPCRRDPRRWISGGSEADIRRTLPTIVAKRGFECPSVGCAAWRLRRFPSPVTPRPTSCSSPIRSRSSIGMLLDQQVPMEWAFRGPSTLARPARYARLRAPIAAMPCDDLEAVFKEKPALHRYPARWRKRTHALCDARRREVRRRRRRDLEGRQRSAGAVRPHPRPPRVRRREGEDLPRHPRASGSRWRRQAGRSSPAPFAD